MKTYKVEYVDIFEADDEESVKAKILDFLRKEVVEFDCLDFFTITEVKEKKVKK